MDIKAIIVEIVKSQPTLRGFLSYEAFKLVGETDARTQEEAQADFEAALFLLVRELYGGRIGKDEFIRMYGDVIANNLSFAWDAGMIGAGRDPENDMLPTYEAIRDNFISQQRDFILRLADDILAAVAAGALVGKFESRIKLWASRFREMETIARVISSPMDMRFTWRLGATEEHCTTCFSIAGQVGTSEQWETVFAMGIYPKSGALECGGWNCDCDVVPTDEPATEGGIRWQ